MFSDWKSFLEVVDETPPDAAVLASAENFLGNIFADPSRAAGITLDKLEKAENFPDELPTQAFLSRSVDALAAVTAARRASIGASMSSATSAPSASSALAMAGLLAPVKTVDTVALLASANLSDLPFCLRIEQSLVDKMSAESEQAKRTGRSPFLFVDLAGREVLPLWITPEQVGGRPDDEAEALDDQSISSLARLGQALNRATEGRRCFSSIVQWTAAFLKYAPFAVSLGHLSWAQVLVHMGTILKMVADEKAEGRGPAVVFVYEEMIRRVIEKRSAAKDPTLKLMDILAEPDKGTLAAARQRVGSLTRTAHLPGNTPDSGAMARAFAANQKKEAQEAAKALQKQNQSRRQAGQASSSQRAMVWERDHPNNQASSSSWHQDSHDNSGYSGRKSKRQQWFSNMTTSWKQQRAAKKPRN